jgi:PAS domain-containing protein
MRSTRVKTRQALGIEEQLSLLDVALQNAYRALARAEARYHDLFDNGPDMYHVIGPDGRFREANQKHAELIGYTPKRWRACSFRKLFRSGLCPEWKRGGIS